jgi:molybdenum cofactor guanylyltransferase
MEMKCSGVILAGGENKRFLGKNKALCLIDGERIIDRIYSVFRSIFDEIILVTNTPELYPDMDAVIVSDIFPVRSSMTGIHTGLFYASNPYAFCSACDTPFLKKEVIRCIVSRIRPRFDLILPETSAGLEPLCAVYARTCLGLLEQNILAHKFKIQRVFNEKRILKIPESIIRKQDPDLSSFFNVNCRDDLSAALDFTTNSQKTII